MNTSEEILFSMSRYVEIYYDVKLSEESANLESIVQDLYSSNSDNMLREYWDEYSASIEDVPAKKKPRRSKTRSSEIKQTKTDESTDQNSVSIEDKPTSEAVSQEKPAKKLKVVMNKKKSLPYHRLKVKKSPEARDETINFEDDTPSASAHSSQDDGMETFFRGQKIV